MNRIFLSILFCSSLLSCDTKSPEASPQKIEPSTWKFQSEFFQIELPNDWKKEDPASLNTFAKFAASKNNSHFILVIPRKLPEIPGIETPDAFALKRASINIIREADKEFKIEVEGPAKIGGLVAQSVVASGVLDGEKLQYVTSYLTSKNIGIQIVAWSPYSEGKSLVRETDKILANFEVINIDKHLETSDGEPSDKLNLKSNNKVIEPDKLKEK